MKIWVLADDRPGNYSQAIGLAEAISRLDFAAKSTIVIKKISYNFLAKLPNCLKISGLIGVDLACRKELLKSSSNSLEANNQKPDLIICAGRKTAPISLFLKKYYQALVVQIMNPNVSSGKFAQFDWVILPNHDQNIIKTFLEKDKGRVLRISGALTRINPKLLDEQYQKFAHQLPKNKAPIIALLIGGSSKKGNFDSKIAQNLSQMVSKIVNNMGANLVVLNSRRTGQEITEIIDQNLNFPLYSSLNVQLGSKIFFKWQAQNWENPYFAVLKAADFIIATGDSISMCSEICAIPKPLYIFNPPEICSPKHLRFHQDLFAQNLARKLDQNVLELENYHPQKLDETSRVAELIIANKKIL